MAVLKDLIVHGSSRFLNKTYMNTLNIDEIEADKGKFNRLLVEDITATNATVLGLLDVKGELHTNTWTNSNIATIDGSFYITPTIGLPDGGTASVSVNSISFAGTGYSLDTIYTNEATSSTTSSVSWTVGSKILVTGEVEVNGEWMPFGTLTGLLGATSSTSVAVNTLKANRPATVSSNPETLAAIISAATEAGIATSSLPYRNVKISMYQTNRTNNGTTYYPLGIYMSALGANGRTFIDIYGGNNAVSTTYTSAMALPVVRVGNLSSMNLPQVGGVTPNGWGIYTSNGFFSGTVAAKQGKIGSGTAIWTIGSDGNNRSYIYSGITNITTTGSTAGTYVGTNGISNYASSTQYVNLTGGKITAQGADITGAIKATSGFIGQNATNGFTISNTAIYNPSTKSTLASDTVDGIYLGKDGIALGKGVFKVTNAGAVTASNITATGGTIGGLAIDETSIHTYNVVVTSNADNSIALSSADFTRTILSTSRAGLRFAIGDKFGITGDGVLYTDGANITNLSASNISTGTLSAERIAVTDFTNYCQLNPNTAALYGWTLTQDSSNPNTPWYVRDTLDRDNYPSTWFDCKPGDMFKVSMTVSSTVTGATTSGGAGGTYMNINLGVQCQTATGSSKWPTFNVATSSAAGTETTKTGYVTIPTSAEYIKFRAFIQIGGVAPFAGTLKIRNPVIKRVGADEYITQINSNGIWVTPSGKKPTNTSTGAGATGTRINSNGMQIFNAGTQVADFGSTITLGQTSGQAAVIDSNGMQIYNGGTPVASFGETISLGDYVEIGNFPSRFGTALYINEDTCFTERSLHIPYSDSTGLHACFDLSVSDTNGLYIEGIDNVNNFGTVFRVNYSGVRFFHPIYTDDIISDGNISPAMGFAKLDIHQRTITSKTNVMIPATPTIRNSELFGVMDNQIVIQKSGYYRIHSSWIGGATLTNNTSVKAFGATINDDTSTMIGAAFGRSKSWEVNSQEDIYYLQENQQIGVVGRNEAEAGMFDHIRITIMPVWLN